MNAEHMPPATPQELVSQMRERYEAFLEACEALSRDQAIEPSVCGEWSAKAVVDHLTGWQVESLPILKNLLGTDDEDFDLDIDAFNRASVRDREDLSWEDSLTAFKLSFESYDKGLEGITVSRFRTNQAFKSWLKAMTHEYQFHIVHIQKAQEF